jgi:hypothetical protein
MTAISTHRVDTTPLERTLLHTASALDHFVSMRLENRAGQSSRTRAAAAAKHEQARAVAQALGALGLLPR